jgi:D-alanyl-lipoteichoic acid acyltransferase DltB (MBOAT superfamily)
MLFNSYEFIFLFLPITLLIFFQIGSRGYRQLAITWLIAASLVFYGWWNVSYVGLLLASVGFNYFIGIHLSRRFTTKYIQPKQLLALGVFFNLGLLGYFKYTDFLISTTNDLIGTSFNLHNIILPLAISFFTFNQIAYLVDAYRGESQEYNFLTYCLFITFFPHLMAGPIVHHKEIIPQFHKESTYHFNSQDVAVGLTIFFLGLFKKVVLADSIAVYASPVFEAAAKGVPVTFLEAWGAAIAYSLQLYFDFSGYSDMAIGVARVFGIKFPLNFNSPYKSLNIIDFWRRWHITLSHFLRDYLYIPLGGNRKGKLRRYVNLMITMLLGGLWHGAGWPFVIWGGLHGIYLVVNHQWHSFRRSLGHDLTKSHWWSRGIACFVTFLALVIAWVFFRAKDLDSALLMIKGMLGINGISIPLTIADKLGTPIKSLLSSLGIALVTEGASQMFFTYLWSIALLAIAWFTPNTQEWLKHYNPALDYQPIKASSEPSNHWGKSLSWQPNKFWSITLGIIAGIGLVYLRKATVFLYFQF